jgi:non-heme chloroperoxidase
MNRRNLFRVAAASAGLLALDAEGIVPGQKPGSEDGAGVASAEALPPYLQTADHTLLFYKDWGKGRPVLFVHSWAVNSDLWQYQMIHLSQRGFRCVAYDQRGCGRSTDPGRGYDFDTLADDLATVVELLDLRDVTLVGHSLGCKEIVRYLSRHGSSRVARVVLVSPGAPLTMKSSENPNGVDDRALQQLHDAWTTDFPKWLAENARPFFTRRLRTRWWSGACACACSRRLRR